MPRGNGRRAKLQPSVFVSIKYRNDTLGSNHARYTTPYIVMLTHNKHCKVKESLLPLISTPLLPGLELPYSLHEQRIAPRLRLQCATLLHSQLVVRGSYYAATRKLLMIPAKNLPGSVTCRRLARENTSKRQQNKLRHVSGGGYC